MAPELNVAPAKFKVSRLVPFPVPLVAGVTVEEKFPEKLTVSPPDGVRLELKALTDHALEGLDPFWLPAPD